MKKFLICAVGLLMTTTQLFSQAKQPTIMVVPSELWCNGKGYYTEQEIMGVVEKVPDYKRALSSDADMNLAISKIGELMSNNGFPLVDLGQTLKSLDYAALESEHLAQADGGIAESSLDKLRATAKADIIISLSYSEKKTNMSSTILFNLQGFDAYTNKQIAASSGTVSNRGGADISTILLGAINNNMEVFRGQLQTHFDSLFELGREVMLECKVANYSPINFDSEVGDDMLGFIIEDWVAANAYGGRFSTTDATEYVLKFSQVRIPMLMEDGSAGPDTRNWTRGLVSELSRKYRVKCTLGMRGLGQAYIIITGTR